MILAAAAAATAAALAAEAAMARSIPFRSNSRAGAARTLPSVRPAALIKHYCRTAREDLQASR